MLQKVARKQTSAIKYRWNSAKNGRVGKAWCFAIIRSSDKNDKQEQAIAFMPVFV